MKKHIYGLALLAAVTGMPMAHAETTPAKKELIAKMLQLQQPAIETLARQLAEGPAIKLMQQVEPVVQFRVAPEKREALGKEVQGEVKKYIDDTVPMLRERAVKLAPGVITPILEEKFSEDELKQIIAFLESPVQRKLGQMSVEVQKGLSAKLVTETRSAVEPKVKALEQAVSQRLNQAATASAAAASAPAKPASK